MTEFVLEVENSASLQGTKLKRIVRYAHFLQQPLKLGMFIPCDEDDNILEQPCNPMNTKGCRDCACREYKKAKENVLFEGFEIKNYSNEEIEEDSIEQVLVYKYCYVGIKLRGQEKLHLNVNCLSETIEDLIIDRLILNQSAIKQLEV